jgi:hypothetical protein
MVIIKNMNNVIIGIILCLQRNKTETIVVHISKGRVNVNHVSAQASVRNFTHIGLKIMNINKLKEIQ